MDHTQDLARLGTGNLGSVVFEGQANSAQPGRPVPQGRQIKPMSGIFIEALASGHKLCIERMLVVCQQAVEVIGGACRIKSPNQHFLLSQAGDVSALRGIPCACPATPCITGGQGDELQAPVARAQQAWGWHLRVKLGSAVSLCLDTLCCCSEDSGHAQIKTHTDLCLCCRHTEAALLVSAGSSTIQ